MASKKSVSVAESPYSSDIASGRMLIEIFLKKTWEDQSV